MKEGTVTISLKEYEELKKEIVRLQDAYLNKIYDKVNDIVKHRNNLEIINKASRMFDDWKERNTKGITEENKYLKEKIKKLESLIKTHNERFLSRKIKI